MEIAEQMKNKAKTKMIPDQLKQAKKNSNKVFRLTVLRHQKRLEKIDKIIETWNSLTFFFMHRRNNRLAADILAECYCSAVGGSISTLHGYYRAGFFYLRDMIEITKAGIYAKEKNLNTLDYLPKRRILDPVINNCSFIRKYNDWCKTKREGEWHIKKILNLPEDVISKYAIHLGSEAISWQKSIPSYSRGKFSLFAEAFEDMGKVLLFLWILYDIDSHTDSDASNLLASFWWMLYPFYRKYIKSEYKNVHDKMPLTRGGVWSWNKE